MRMPINLQDNEIMLRCACYAHEHTAMLAHEPNDSRDCKLKGENDDWYLSISLANHRFSGRIKKALQYVFRPSTIRYGMYAEIVLRDEDVERVAEFIRERRGRAAGTTPPPTGPSSAPSSSAPAPA